MNVVVNKTELLNVLRENRDAHRAIFLEALEAYKEKSIELLEKQIQNLEKGKFPIRYSNLLIPEDHTEDYNRIISMLQMDIRKEFKLEENDYASYVLDDWQWKAAWLSNTLSYTSS